MSKQSASGDQPVRSVEQIAAEIVRKHGSLCCVDDCTCASELCSACQRLASSIASALRAARQQAFTAGWDAHYEWATHEWGPAPPETAEEAYKEWAASSGAQGEQ